VPLLTEPVLPPGSLASGPQPEIAGDGVLLRPWRPADAPSVVAGYSDPAIQQWHARSMDADEAAEWIAAWPVRRRAETDAGWAITDGSAVVGQIALRSVRLDDGLAHISYWVLPSARGGGFAARALMALAGWALDDLGLHRLEVYHSTANVASCRVAERAFFAAEGVKRSEALHADGWHDMHQHARIRGDQP